MLNKILKICSSVFLVVAFAAPGFADEHFPFLAEVSKESVNVRAGPNTNFEKVDKLHQGAQVVVLGRSYEWLKVQPLATTKVFIRSDYLKLRQGTGFAEVLGDNVNVRASANSDAASLGEVKKGTLVKVIENIKGWSSLEPVAGTIVWINQNFLKEISSDVPASLLIPEIQMPLETIVTTVTQHELPIVKQVTEQISLQGKLVALAQSPADQVHYQIAIDDKNIYYLQDIPQLSFFADTVVTVEGTVIPDPLKKYTHPLLHINKIALVL